MTASELRASFAVFGTPDTMRLRMTSQLAFPRPLPLRRSEKALLDHQGQTLYWILAILSAIVFEGAARKWIAPPGLHPLIFGMKDVLAVVFIFRHPVPARIPFLSNLKGCFLLVGLTLVPALIIGSLQSPQGAIISFKNAFLWLVFATHLAAHLDETVIRRLIPILSCATCGLAVLGIAQYSSPADAWINRYAWSALDSSTFIAGYASTGVRATGTFSFISGFTSYSVFAFSVFLWRLTSAGLRTELWFNVAGCLGAIACGLASGSRAASVYWGLSIVLVLLVGRNLKASLNALVLLALLSVFLLKVFDAGIVESYLERWNYEDAAGYGLGRATSKDLRGDYAAILSANPLGEGLGAQSNLAAFDSTQGKGSNQGNYDDGGTRGIVEGGLLGLLAQLITQVVAIWLALRGLLSKDRQYRLCSAAIGACALFSVFGCGWHDHNAAAMNGVLVAIYLGMSPEVQAAMKANLLPRRTGPAARP